MLSLRLLPNLMIFAKRVLRKIFGPKKEEVTREWSNLQIAELHDLYPSPNILGVIKPRRVRYIQTFGGET